MAPAKNPAKKFSFSIIVGFDAPTLTVLEKLADSASAILGLSSDDAPEAAPVVAIEPEPATETQLALALNPLAPPVTAATPPAAAPAAASPLAPPTPAAASAAPVASAAPATGPAPLAPPQPQAVSPDKKAVREALQVLTSSKGGRQASLNLLAEFGADAIGELPKDKYTAIIERANAEAQRHGPK